MKEELEDILEIKEPRKPISAIKKKYWRFKFKLFGRTFYFETYVEGNIEPLFKPVEPCESSEIANWLCNLRKEGNQSITEIPEFKEILEKERERQRKARVEDIKSKENHERNL